MKRPAEFHTSVAAVAALALVPAALLAPGTAVAQEAGTRDPGVACTACVDVSATYGTLIGEDFAEQEHGFGMEAVFRHTWDGGFGLGLGGRFSSLTIHEGRRTDETLEIVGVFVEPRFTWNRDGRLHPFVGWRVDLLELEDPDIGSDGGWGVGLVGGLDYRASGSLTFTASLHEGSIFLGNSREGASREARAGLRLRL